MGQVGVIAFQAIGAYFGGPIGAMIGGMIGNALFTKPPTIRNEGPRLENLKTISSQYGAVINQIYGTVRTAGSGIIWGTDVEEVKNTTTQKVSGGKGNKQKVVNTTWSYYGKFAILICKGKIDGVPRFWINSDLIFDFSDQNLGNSGGVSTLLEKDGVIYGQRVNLDSDKMSGEITFYFGTDNQPVDPTIESVEGVGNYTAHRGHAYAVFNRIDLTAMQGNIPNYNFEVRRTGIALEDQSEDKADYDLVDLSDINEELTNAQLLGYSLHGDNGQSMHYNRNDGYAYGLLTDVFQRAIILQLNVSQGSGGDTSLKGYRRLKGYDYEFWDWNPNWINDPDKDEPDFDKSVYMTKKPINTKNRYEMQFGKYLDFSENSLFASSQYNPAGIGTFPTPVYNVTGLAQGVIYLEGAYENEHKDGISRPTYPNGQGVTVIDNIMDRQGNTLVDGTTGEYKEVKTMKFFNLGDINESIIHVFHNLPTEKNVGRVSRYVIQYGTGTDYLNYSCGFNSYGNAKMRFYAMNQFHAITIYDNQTTGLREFHLSSLDNFKFSKFFEVPISENWNFNGVTYDKTSNKAFVAVTRPSGQRQALIIKIALGGTSGGVSIKDLNNDENFKEWYDQGLRILMSNISINSSRACFIGAILVNNNGQTQGNILCTYNIDSEASTFKDLTEYSTEHWEGKYLRTNLNAFYSNRNSCLYQPSSQLIEKDGKVYLELLKYYGKRFEYKGFGLIGMITEICKISGLTEDDLDFSELVDSEIRGYTINSESTGRGVIEHLAYVFNFGLVETNGKIKFKTHGSTSVMSFDENELGVQNYGADINFEDLLTTTRLDEKTLPETINFTYSNINFEYENDTQEHRMIGTTSVNVVSNEIPIVLDADEAKAVTVRIMDNTWTARDKFNFSINYMKGIKLEPLDVITVRTPGFTHNMKIAKLERQGGIIKIEAFSENASVYDQSTAVGGTSEQKPRPQLSNISKTDIRIFDIPLVDNNLKDDAGFYLGVLPMNTNDTWQGATVFSTYDPNIPYEEKLSFVNDLNIGTVKNSVNNFSLNIVDCANYIDVQFDKEIGLNSITEEQFFDGGNMCLIDNEILQFKEAELIGLNKYRLTKLLRGRFGTEINLNFHDDGSKFIMLDEAIKNLPKGLTEAGRLEFFKAVSFGDDKLNDFDTQYSNQSIRLKTLAPFNINSTRDQVGNLYFNWKNRIRGINTSLEPVGDTFDNDGLSFRVLIYNKSRDKVLRTINIDNLTESSYSASQQTSDFGSLQTSVNIDIYKLNKFGQLGFPLQVSI